MYFDDVCLNFEYIEDIETEACRNVHTGLKEEKTTTNCCMQTPKSDFQFFGRDSYQHSGRLRFIFYFLFIFLATEACLVEVLNHVQVHFLPTFLNHSTDVQRSYFNSLQDEQHVHTVDTNA